MRRISKSEGEKVRRRDICRRWGREGVQGYGGRARGVRICREKKAGNRGRGVKDKKAGAIEVCVGRELSCGYCVFMV